MRLSDMVMELQFQDVPRAATWESKSVESKGGTMHFTILSTGSYFAGTKASNFGFSNFTASLSELNSHFPSGENVRHVPVK